MYFCVKTEANTSKGLSPGPVVSWWLWNWTFAWWFLSSWPVPILCSPVLILPWGFNKKLLLVKLEFEKGHQKVWGNRNWWDGTNVYLMLHFQTLFQIFYLRGHRQKRSEVVLVVKNLLPNADRHKRLGSIPGSGRSPGEGNGNPPSILAWRIPCTKEPGGLQSIGLHRDRHNWSDLACTHKMQGGPEVIHLKVPLCMSCSLRFSPFLLRSLEVGSCSPAVQMVNLRLMENVKFPGSDVYPLHSAQANQQLHFRWRISRA